MLPLISNFWSRNCRIERESTAQTREIQKVETIVKDIDDFNTQYAKDLGELKRENEKTRARIKDLLDKV